MIKVSKEFIDDFTLCMKHYECTDEEIQDAKAAARLDYEMAKLSYREIASNIRSFPEVARDEKYILVSDMIFDKPKEKVVKAGGKKVVKRKLKEAEKVKLKD